MLLVIISHSPEGIAVTASEKAAQEIVSKEIDAHAFVVDTDALKPHVHHICLDPVFGTVEEKLYRADKPPKPITVLDGKTKP